MCFLQFAVDFKLAEYGGEKSNERAGIGRNEQTNNIYVFDLACLKARPKSFTSFLVIYYPDVSKWTSITYIFLVAAIELICEMHIILCRLALSKVSSINNKLYTIMEQVGHL